MWNLLKNVFRSLVKNKIAVIGLTFLIFLSVGMFTVLQSTTTNINNTYDKVSTQGNQHDFTISEKYDIGNIKFAAGSKTKGEGVGTSSDLYTVYWPDQVKKEDGTFTKRYYLKLDASLTGDSIIDKFYQEYYDQPESPEYQYLFRTFSLNNSNELTYMDGDHESSKSYVQIQEQLGDAAHDGKDSDLVAINVFLTSWSTDLNNYLTEYNSPLNQYLTSDLKDQVYFRNFRSLKINNSTDGVYYDVVESCPEDDQHPYDSIVDREIVFNTKDFDGLGWNNFSVNDWKPSSLISSGDEVRDVLNHKLETWNTVKNSKKEQTYVRKFIDILTRGKVNSSTPAQDFITLISQIDGYLKASPDVFPSDSTDLATAYSDFLTNYTLKDVNDKKYEYVLSYEKIDKGTSLPFTWLLGNWTSNFGIFAPQYLQKKGYKPLDISKLLQNDKDYQEWIFDHQDILTERARFISWMNSLSQDQIEEKVGTSENGWQALYPNSVIKVGGGTPFFILAAGITGDYVYPVVSIERPIPNPNSECIFFGNNSAYERVQIAFQGNQTEKYVVGKFYNKKDGQKILNKINIKCRDIMAWPDNINAAYMANDLSCTLNAAAFRISYIPQLVEKVNLISYLLTVFILVVGLIISGIIVRRYVTSNRSTIGIMQANGIKKWTIALSLTPFAFIPSLLGGICGYLIGTFLQSTAIGLFSAYWTLPTNLLAFSWPSLLLSIFLPFLIFVIVSIGSTYIVLREKTTDLMKSGSEFKSNWLSRVIKKLFKKFGVLTKFRVSIAFNSLWKLTILSIMGSLAMSSLVFGMTMNGKFDSAIAKTSDTRNYTYSVDLYSPTTQGGQYIPISANSFGKSGFQTSASNAGENFLPSLFSNKTSWSWDTSWDGISSTTEQTSPFYKKYYNASFELINLAHFHIAGTDWSYQPFEYENTSHQNVFIPFLGDSIGQKTDLQYLKNRVSSQSTMNYLIGVAALGMTSNPWDIAASLMPENSRNICAQKYQNLINEIGYEVYHPTASSWDSDTYRGFFTQTSENTYEINQSNVVDYSGLGLNHDFITLLIKAYTDTYTIDKITYPLIQSAQDDFLMTYNSIPLSSQEETYTYLTVNGVKNSGNSSLPVNQKIIGLYDQSTCMNLIDDNNNDLLPLLSIDKDFVSSIEEFPMVVNELVAKKYNVGIGSTMSFNVTNKANRYVKQINNDVDNDITKFKIVGIMKSRENEEYFIDQQVANYILGLKSTLSDTYELNNSYIDYNKAVQSTITVDDGKNSEASINDISAIKTTDQSKNIIPYGFNGYFTKDPNGSKALSNGYSCYSPDGLYLPSSDLLSNSSADVFKYGANLQIANILTGLDKTEFGQTITNAYETWKKDKNFENWTKFVQNNLDEFRNKIGDLWGNTTYVSLITNAMDKNSNEMVYLTMSNTISNIEIVVLIIIAFMVFFIVLLMSSIIISDSKKLAAILSSLGYTDMENALSFMSIYIPVIIIGLLIAIPLTMGFTAMFQLAIMKGIGLLVDATTKWYFYLTGACVVVFELICSIISSWISLRKGSLSQMIK